MTRAYRIFLNDINRGKSERLKSFVIKCREITQYLVDLFWQRKDFTGKLADLPTVHTAIKRYVKVLNNH